ncbi:MAG: copper resistance protein B [Gemmatimonadaceae bacterium]|nr:copper resistance protein B [Gemmatimonadaceae bacterium]
MMQPDRIAHFFAVPALVATLMLASSGRLRAQVADTLPHSSAHNMSWGRETFVLSEVLEYAPSGVNRPVNYDLLAWTGGAVNRLWAKADGGIATRGSGLHGEYQLLYGRLVSPWWDAQIGVRVDHANEDGGAATRAGAVAGLQGLAPGWFEVEPSLFVTTDGNVSLDLTASYDLYLTQRLVLQPRLESAVSLRDDVEFGIGRGLSSTSFGLRTRLEVRREFAPYIGVVWDRSYGRTAQFARQAGAAAGEARLVAGLRLWR